MKSQGWMFALAELGEQVVAALSPSVRQHMHRFGCDQLDLTQPPPPLKENIRVHLKKEIGWFCGRFRPEKGEGKAEKEKIGSSNEALLIGKWKLRATPVRAG